MKPRQLSPNDETVLDALGRSPRPLSAYDILNDSRSASLKAPVQVYRSLQKLQQHGLVHRIEALNAFIACSGHGHDHRPPGFVICRDCGAVREFADDRIQEIAQGAAGEGFAIDLVSLEVYGRCQTCSVAA